MRTGMTITYEVEDKLYLNITNQCPCDCVFCIRQNGDGAYGSDPLWLSHEPSFEEIISALEARDLNSYAQVVFCGYGEPAMRCDILCKTAEHIKSKTDIPVRLNTNGLADLIYGFDVVPKLSKVIDIVSISLNAPNAKEYTEVTRPVYGEKAFDAMCDFAVRCKAAGIETMFTVVDIIPKAQIEASRKLCEKMGIPLRIREMVK